MRIEAHEWAALAIAGLLGAGGGGCTIVGGVGAGGSGPTTTSTATTSHEGGSGGATTSATTTGGAGGGAPVSGRALFEATCQKGLLGECAPCHGDNATTPVQFLLGPDYYDSITHWPNVVLDPPSSSILLTYPGQSSHVGPNLTPDLRAKLTTWLELEASLLPKEGGMPPPITPFKPYVNGAFNAIRLDPLGPEFVNSSITFEAELLPEGPSPTLLHLSKIEVHPIKGIQIRVVHPLFTVYPPNAAPAPDVADSFSGLDETYVVNGPTLTMGTGEVILSGWVDESRLGIAFEKIEVIKTGSPGSTCKNVAKFQAEVVPQLKQWQCASLCHAGANVAAQQQMDLTNLDLTPPDEACGQVRARITPGDPAGSQIIQVTDPAFMGVHGFKFMGNKNNYAAFKAAVSPWIIAEQ